MHTEVTLTLVKGGGTDTGCTVALITDHTARVDWRLSFVVTLFVNRN